MLHHSRTLHPRSHEQSEWCCKTEFITLHHGEGEFWAELEPGTEPERQKVETRVEGSQGRRNHGLILTSGCPGGS